MFNHYSATTSSAASYCPSCRFHYSRGLAGLIIVVQCMYPKSCIAWEDSQTRTKLKMCYSDLVFGFCPAFGIPHFPHVPNNKEFTVII
jgi:hypothetical protein